MAWNTREIEEITRNKLISKLQQGPGEEWYGLYTSARKCLVEEILPAIKGVLPELTDHGPQHVENVLDNTRKLLGTDIEKLGAMDLYCLILSILFHDVGNIFARKEHQRNVSQVYNYVRGDKVDRREHFVVLKAASAHCGEANDGSKDTLKDLDEKTFFGGGAILLRDIAAILRFADELAEGPQRTSKFMQIHHNYPPDSYLYHKYANITTVDIDRLGERIALTYDMSFHTNGDNKLGQKEQNEILELLKFTHKRIVKLNQERQYAKHYSAFLSPFRKTTVIFNFWANGELLDLTLDEVRLTDLVVPDDEAKEFVKYAPSHTPENVIALIENCLRKK